MKKVLLSACLLFSLIGVFAQNATITGKVVDSNSGDPVVGVAVELNPGNGFGVTDSEGVFTLKNIAPGNYILYVDPNSEIGLVRQVVVEAGETTITLENLAYDTAAASNDYTVLTDINLDVDDEIASGVSGLLSASRDPFLNKAGYQFGSDTFFRVRGIDSRNNHYMINGLRFQNPETGWSPYSLFGGLNDVLRYRDEVTVGLNESERTFGGVGGVTNYEIRPSTYRKGARFTYSNLNRNYSHRAMLTYASGDKNGFSYLLSGSKRWAQEGYVEGTYYDAYGVHAGVEGKVSDKYSVAASFTAAPRRRGTQGTQVQEVYDLMNDNFYNPDWGWQDGEKRNARLRKNYSPTMMMNHYLKLGESTDIRISGAYQFGHYKSSFLERYEADNPTPDYYRKLPGYFKDPAQRQIVTEQFKNDVNKRQIDWNTLYYANLVSGGRARYILSEDVRDDNLWIGQLAGSTILNDNITLDYAGNYQFGKYNFYKTVNDLLGAEYWLDEDSFESDAASRPNNTLDPDPKAYVNNRFGYDYDLHKEDYNGFLQGRFSYNKIDAHLSAKIGQVNYLRNGFTRNGRYLDASLGKSPKTTFDVYGAKGGVTYKLDGRNYINVNGAYYTEAPRMDVVYISPTERPDITENVKEEVIMSGEASYQYRSPGLTLRLTGYYTNLEDLTDKLLAFTETATGDAGFTNFLLTGIDMNHYGGELGFNAQATPTISVSGAAAVGKYTYSSRPYLTIYQDGGNGLERGNGDSDVLDEGVSYLKNFYDDNTPQTALNLGLNYRSPKFWYFNVDGNYYDNAYASASPYRRTLQIAEQFDPANPTEFYTDQEKLPNAIRLNGSIGKSLRFPNRSILGFNLSVQNILDKKDYPNLAFEGLRLDKNDDNYIDPSLFPTKYRYSRGRTYYLNAYYRF